MQKPARSPRPPCLSAVKGNADMNFPLIIYCFCVLWMSDYFRADKIGLSFFPLIGSQLKTFTVMNGLCRCTPPSDKKGHGRVFSYVIIFFSFRPDKYAISSICADLKTKKII